MTPPPPLELFRKFIHFGRGRRPLLQVSWWTWQVKTNPTANQDLWRKHCHMCFDKLVYWYALENAIYKWKLVRSVMCCPHSAWYIFCPGSQDIWGWEGGGRPPPWSPNIYKFHICQEEHLNGGAQWRKVKNCIICDVLILRSQRECFEFWMYLNEKKCWWASLPPTNGAGAVSQQDR